MDKAHQIRLGYVDTSLGQIHYRQCGSGPTVVLFHESPLSGAIYEKALPFLGERVQAIAPDTPGYGASAAPPVALSIEGYASRMSKFLDAFGIDCVVLVGNHTGASLGISLAAEEPERVRGLIVLGPPLFSKEEQEEWLIKNKYLEPFPLSPDGSHLSWLWNRYERIWGAGTPAELLHLATTEMLRVAFRYDWAYRAAFLFNAAELLPRVACPTLFLTTEGDTLRNKHEEAMALTRSAEGRLINFPNGQFPAREPKWFSEEVLGFLTRIRFLK